MKKNKSRILIVNPGYHKSIWTAYLPPGPGYLCESLDENGIENDFFDMNLYSYKNLIKKIKRFKPDYIGIPMMTYDYMNHYIFIDELKKAFSRIKIIMGGPHVALFGEKIMEQCSGVDILVIGEGERTIVEIAKNKPLRKIDNLIYRQGKKVIRTKSGEYIQDLDKLPFPKYKKFKIGKYQGNMIPIISSRGCPYSCTYCAAHLSVGKKVRARSAKNVVDEIEYWYKKGYMLFNFYDDNFTFYKERVYEICDEIEKRGLKGLNLDGGNDVRADTIDYALLKRMKEVGWTALSIGVEAASDKMLKIIKKGEDIKTIEKAIKNATDLGYSTTLYFIIGFPRQTVKDIEETFKLAIKYPVSNVYLYPIIPYPGTEMFEEIKRNGRFFYEPEQYLNSKLQMEDVVIFETPEINRKQREILFKRAKKISSKVKRNFLIERYSRIFPFNYIAAALISNQKIENFIYANRLLKKVGWDIETKTTR